jgi:hypothetical protein
MESFLDPQIPGVLSLTLTGEFAILKTKKGVFAVVVVVLNLRVCGLIQNTLKAWQLLKPKWPAAKLFFCNPPPLLLRSFVAFLSNYHLPLFAAQQ